MTIVSTFDEADDETPAAEADDETPPDEGEPEHAGE